MIWIIMLAVLFDGEISTFVAGKSGRVSTFLTLAECEVERDAVKKWAIETLAANPRTQGAKVLNVECVEKESNAV